MDGNYVEITAKIVINKMYIVWVVINLINSITKLIYLLINTSVFVLNMGFLEQIFQKLDQNGLSQRVQIRFDFNHSKSFYKLILKGLCRNQTCN